MVFPIDLESCIDVSYGEAGRRTVIFVLMTRVENLNVEVVSGQDIPTTLVIVLGPNKEEGEEDGHPDLTAIEGDPNYQRAIATTTVNVTTQLVNTAVRLVNGSDLLPRLERLGTRCPTGDQMNVENVLSDTPVTLHWLQKVDTHDHTQPLLGDHTEFVVPYGHIRVRSKLNFDINQRMNLNPRDRIARAKLAVVGGMAEKNYIGWLTSVRKKFPEADKAENHVILLNGLAPSAFTRIILLVPKPNMFFITHEHFQDELHLILVHDMAQVREALMQLSIEVGFGVNNMGVAGSDDITTAIVAQRYDRLLAVPEKRVSTIRSRGQDFWRNLRGQPVIEQTKLLSYWQQTTFHDFFYWESALPRFECQLNTDFIKTLNPTPEEWHVRSEVAVTSSVGENVFTGNESIFATERRGDTFDTFLLRAYSSGFYDFAMTMVYLKASDLFRTEKKEDNQALKLDFGQFQRPLLEGNEWSARSTDNWRKLVERFDGRTPAQKRNNDVPFPVVVPTTPLGPNAGFSVRETERATPVNTERHMLVFVMISDDMAVNAWYGARNIPRNVKVYLASFQDVARRMAHEHSGNSGGSMYDTLFLKNALVTLQPDLSDISDDETPGPLPEAPMPARYVGSGNIKADITKQWGAKKTIPVYYNHFVIFVKNKARITQSLIDEALTSAPASNPETPSRLYVVVQGGYKDPPGSPPIVIYVDANLEKIRQEEIFVVPKSTFFHVLRISSAPLFDTDKEFPLLNYMHLFDKANHKLPMAHSPRSGRESLNTVLERLRTEEKYAIGQAPANTDPVPGPSRRNASQGPSDASHRRDAPSGRQGDRRNTSQDSYGYRSSGSSREQSRDRSPSRERRRSESQESVASRGPSPGTSRGTESRDRRDESDGRDRNRRDSSGTEGHNDDMDYGPKLPEGHNDDMEYGPKLPEGHNDDMNYGPKLPEGSKSDSESEDERSSRKKRKKDKKKSKKGKRYHSDSDEDEKSHKKRKKDKKSKKSSSKRHHSSSSDSDD